MDRRNAANCDERDRSKKREGQKIPEIRHGKKSKLIYWRGARTGTGQAVGGRKEAERINEETDD